MFYFARCMNIIFNSQLVKYDVHTTRKIKSIQAIFITYYYYLTNRLVCAVGISPNLQLRCSSKQHWIL